MPQNHISDDPAPARRKLQFWSPQTRVMVIASLILFGIAAIISVTKITHMGAGSSATSASSSPNTNGMYLPAQSLINTTNHTNTQTSSAIPGMVAFATPAQRLVIETASLAISVTDVRTTSDKINQLVASNNGFVQSMNEYANQGQSTTNMTVRVPETAYEGLLSALKSYGTVNNFSQTGQDVTEQHNNLQEQINQLQSEADAYNRLYSRAQSMQDMLEIQQSLSQVNAEISNIQNQLHDLNRSVQLATISVNLTSGPSVSATKSTSFIGALKQSIQFMGHAAKIMLNVIAWLLPWGAVATLIGYGWNRWVRWRKSRSNH